MDGIIYNTTDGCSKQYRCANSMWMFSILAFTLIVIIDILNNAPGSGIIKIDGINRSDKTYLRQKYAW